jgi:molybdenum cofactor cytidylyltransferase
MPETVPETPAERPGPIAGVLLAAGTASRMGRNKMLLDLGGESMLRRAARQALDGGLSPLLVVLGHQAEESRRELAGLACEVVLNPDYEQGVNSSVKRGIAALPPDARAAMVLLADMPFVDAGMIASLIDRYREGDAPLVISDYDGVNAPPMLYDRSLFGELLEMTGEGCGRQVVKRHRSEADVLCWPTSALADLDLPDDYERWKSRSGR